VCSAQQQPTTARTAAAHDKKAVNTVFSANNINNVLLAKAVNTVFSANNINNVLLANA